jgi:hypothetical protein
MVGEAVTVQNDRESPLVYCDSSLASSLPPRKGSSLLLSTLVQDTLRGNPWSE